MMIDALIDSAILRQQRERQDAEARTQNGIEKARALAASAFGDLWNEIADHVTLDDVQTRGNGDVTRVIFRVDGDDLYLSEFFICVQGGKTVVGRYPNGSVQFSVADRDALADFLAARRNEFLTSQADKRQQQIDFLLSKLQSPRWSSNAVSRPEEAQAVLNQLLNLDPDRADEFQNAYVEWKDEYTKWVEEQNEEARQHQLMEEYRRVYRDYYKEIFSISKRNLQALAQLQERLNNPFQVWILSYGVVAYEDGETYAETRSVRVAADAPDDDGYWTVIRPHHQGLCRVRYYHPVAVEGPIWISPTESVYSGRIYLTANSAPLAIPHHTRIHYNPLEFSDDDVRRMALEVLQPFPDEPPEPPGLDPALVQRVRSQVAQQIEAEEAK